jgi:NhaP-type Na+/H+ or K+/H+ antiporter
MAAPVLSAPVALIEVQIASHLHRRRCANAQRAAGGATRLAGPRMWQAHRDALLGGACLAISTKARTMSFARWLALRGTLLLFIALSATLLGLLQWAVPWLPAAGWFVPLMLLVVRPLSVAVGLAGSRISPVQRRLIGWFGIRGIGSLYYLSYAIDHGLPHERTTRSLPLAFAFSSISELERSGLNVRFVQVATDVHLINRGHP